MLYLPGSPSYFIHLFYQPGPLKKMLHVAANLIAINSGHFWLVAISWDRPSTLHREEAFSTKGPRQNNAHSSRLGHHSSCCRSRWLCFVSPGEVWLHRKYLLAILKNHYPCNTVPEYIILYDSFFLPIPSEHCSGAICFLVLHLTQICRPYPLFVF